MKKFLPQFLKKKDRVLVVVGGKISKIEPFLDAAKNVGINVTLASMNQLTYSSMGEFRLFINGVDVKHFTKIYIRMVGKYVEEATLLVNYAQKHRIKIFDSLYNDVQMLPSSLGKSVEMMKLITHSVSMPKTIVGSVSYLEKVAVAEIGFPLVLKSTTGRKAREVWSPETKKDLAALYKKLAKMEKMGMSFFAQEFIPASERIRVLVVGGKAMAAIVRPTKWRKRVGSEGRKMVLRPIPAEMERLSIIASKACGLDVAGVDIVKNDKSGELYILEVNAAPVWKALSHDTGLKVEEEILKYISRQ